MILRLSKSNRHYSYHTQQIKAFSTNENLNSTWDGKKHLKEIVPYSEQVVASCSAVLKSLENLSNQESETKAALEQVIDWTKSELTRNEEVLNYLKDHDLEGSLLFPHSLRATALCTLALNLRDTLRRNHMLTLNVVCIAMLTLLAGLILFFFKLRKKPN